MVKWHTLGTVVGVVIAIATPTEADAQGRTTAIVNLADDQASGALAARALRKVLEKHPNLRPLPPGVLARGLEEAVPTAGPEAVVLARARAQLAKAKSELDSFRASRALSAVSDAVTAVLAIPPSADGQALLADLAFFAGRVHLREQNRGFARSYFELALRLVPEFSSPDPGRFNPDIVSTFAEARARLSEPGGGTLEVSATFDGAEILVDGKRVGATPLAVTVASGKHYVTAIAPEHRISTREIDVGDGDAELVHFDLVALPREDIALRLRQIAMTNRVTVGGPGLDKLARSALDLANADSAIIIRGSAGNLEISAYRTTSERGSRFRDYTDDGVDNALAILSPVRSLRPDELFNSTPPKDPLYRRPEMIAGATGVFLVAVALTVFGVAAADGAPGVRPAVPGVFK